MSLTGRVVIVTGATGALGGEVTAALIAEGARVAVPFRDQAGFEALRARQAEGADLFGSLADVSRRDQAAAFVDLVRQRLGRLDGLACVAGAYAGSGPLHASPEGEWDALLHANLESVHSVCRAALPHLSRGASIVTVGARLVEGGGAGAAAYAVSKAAVHALTRALAAENRARGVRVNCVLPGILDTPQNRAAMPQADPAQWTPPAEVARAIVFLLSSASSAVTGALVPVDARA